MLNGVYFFKILYILRIKCRHSQGLFAICMNIDVVEIVEILSIESSEDEHAAAEETSTMSSSWFGSLPGDFQAGDCVSLWVQHEDIAEIIAEPASVDVDFILVYC